ncbi:MAG TPA: alpha/beta fold hydrolase, partial [Xanthomonadaceae bacterium]|nr:alpha/beta fold hydrolase [Xanthomonadaceae bacterium]
LPKQAGAARGRGAATVGDQGGVQLVVVPLHYANAELVAKVAVQADGKIAGFLVQPAPPPPTAAPAANAGFSERDFTVAGLPGTLALPDGASATAPVPAVVLVHGSGPHDRDETIGPNRPFLDIARGLAAEGIAVLRYEKRTKARPQDFADGDFDMDDETTDDAVAAVAALREVEGIDPARVYVLGHSQGGMLAPRIALQSGDVAGLVMLAAPARSLLDILPEQNRYLLGLDGTISAEEQAFLDVLDAQIAAVRSDADVAASDLPLGLPANYWRAFDAIDPVADARKTDVPLLFLQGGRDIQVVAADWQLWQDAFADDPRATLHHYPALNHLGIAGEGPGSLAEYQQPGHVDARLIADIAAWIHAREAE